MRFQIEKHSRRPIDVQPEFVQIGHDRIIGSTTWTAADGKRHERFQVLTVRDGKIVDIEGCASRRAAVRTARRR